MAKFASIIIVSLFVSQISFADLRGAAEVDGLLTNRQTQQKRVLAADLEASNEDISKYLQYNKIVGSIPQQWINVVYATIGLGIFGPITYYVYQKHPKTTPITTLQGAQLTMPGAMLLLNIKDFWYGVRNLYYQSQWAANAEGLMTKED